MIQISVKTSSLSAAIRRAQTLAASLKADFERVIEMLTRAGRPVTGDMIETVVRELLETRLRAIIAEDLAGPERSLDEADARVAELAAREEALRDAGRRRDFAAADAPLAAALRGLGLGEPAEPEVAGALRARAFGAVRAAESFARGLAEEGAIEPAADEAKIPIDLVRKAAAPRFGPRIDVAAAVEASIRYATSEDMRHHARAHGAIALEFWGPGLPLEAVDERALLDALMFARRLPRDHGRRHGINRYTKDKAAARAAQPSKAQEIERADLADEAVREEVMELDVSEREAVASLMDMLTPRVTVKTLQNLHAGLRRIFEVARHHLNYKGPVPGPVMKDLSVASKHAAAREQHDNAAIVTRRIVRRCWSDERLTALLASPLYRGGFSAKRRWREGQIIVRDALYWVPLIMLFMGLRPGEATQLHKADILRRNGVAAISVDDDGDKSIKRDASRRLVPIHRTLLELGFLDWVNEQRDRPGVHLFPEIVSTVAAEGSVSRRFGDRFDGIRIQLGIKDLEEDLYAVRRTFATRLYSAGVDDADRRALVGHRQEDVINQHYTDREIVRLKTLIDRVDYRVRVAMDPRRGFPVIVGCDLVARASVAVDVELDSEGHVAGVTVFMDATGDRAHFKTEIRPLRSWPAYDREERREALCARRAAQLAMTSVADRNVILRSRGAQKAWEEFLSII